MSSYDWDTHDIPKPTEQYDKDIQNRGTSNLPNPHPQNKEGQYLDSTLTWRESCGCSEANALDNNHLCNITPKQTTVTAER